MYRLAQDVPIPDVPWGGGSTITTIAAAVAAGYGFCGRRDLNLGKNRCGGERQSSNGCPGSPARAPRAYTSLHPRCPFFDRLVVRDSGAFTCCWRRVV